MGTVTPAAAGDAAGLLWEYVRRGALGSDPEVLSAANDLFRFVRQALSATATATTTTEFDMAKDTRRKPHQEALTLDTIGDLAAGQARAVINAALRAAVRDVEDRGSDKKPRKVTIEVLIEKVGKDGTGVVATVKAKTTAPPYATDPTFGDLQAGERGQPEMAFSPAAPDNPDQPPLSGLGRDE